MICPSRSVELAEDGLLLTNRYSGPAVHNLDHHRAIFRPGRDGNRSSSGGVFGCILSVVDEDLLDQKLVDRHQWKRGR
jgi:hypothetical protein